MKALIKMFFVLGVCFGISACIPNQSIYLRNGSNDTVFWDFFWIVDSTIPKVEPRCLVKLEPYSTFYLIDTSDIEADYGWSDNSIGVYILKQSTLEKYSKEELEFGNIYDKLYILNLCDLKKMNYVIVYPYDRK